MKYIRIFSISIREQLAYLPALLMRNIFFVVVFYIFYCLWSAIYHSRATLEGFTLVQMVWYLAFTESIELSRSGVMNQISEEVKDGTVVYGLARPYHYVIFKVARGMGESIIRCLPVLVIGFLVALFFVGPLPDHPQAIPFGLILIAGGLLLNVIWQVIIGLLAFWFEEVSPFFWIMQKLIFIIGGLFFPIDIYPDWLASISRYSPFAFSAYWPARTMVKFDMNVFFIGLLGVIIYGTMLFLVATTMFAVARKRVQVQGG